MSAFKTNILLLRHGESEANAFVHETGKMSEYSEEMTRKIASAGPNPALSVRGKYQAVITADNLKTRLFIADRDSNVVFIASPMQRAKETATPVANILKHKKIKFDHNMIEYDGKTYEEALEFVNKVVDFYFMLQKKAELACEDQTIFLIGHSLFFSLLLHVITLNQASLEKTELCCKLAAFFINGHFINVAFHLPNCSISSLQVNQKGQWKIFGVGKTDHLPISVQTGTHSMF